MWFIELHAYSLNPDDPPSESWFPPLLVVHPDSSKNHGDLIPSMDVPTLFVVIGNEEDSGYCSSA